LAPDPALVSYALALVHRHPALSLKVSTLGKCEMSISQHHLDSFEITEKPPWKTDDLPTSSQMIRDLAIWLDQVNQSGDDLRTAAPVTWVQQGENDIATAGIRRAFKLLQDEYRQKVDGQFSRILTIDMICHVHEELLPEYASKTNQHGPDGILIQWKKGGQVRSCKAYTVRPHGAKYKYPPPGMLESLLLTAFDIHNGNMLHYHEHMTRETNEKKLIHLIKCAALMFCKVITIHPFGDGNGRLCRLLANEVLFDLIPLPIPFYDVGNVTKDTYFDAIMKHQDCNATGGDPSDISALILHGLWHAGKLHIVTQ
jgi:hypothetical protein